jgi:hypothetical protein
MHGQLRVSIEDHHLRLVKGLPANENASHVAEDESLRQAHPPHKILEARFGSNLV